ncbi:MAG: Na+/H+ antiporter NhaA [Deltaproteobacteria bacterium]|nr:Na+/H+ antiporter NhaA [Deltaproteobacteria bacterium]
MALVSNDRPSHPSSPPEAWAPLVHLARRARRPLDRFLQIEAASGIVLLVLAAVAMAWANSPWAASYFRLWETPLGVHLGGAAFERPLAWFVNDGLMAIFFFVVGLEIRRESHHGELSEWRRAALPAAAALGGMVAPALLYLAIAGAPSTRSGWGVPMATDIAFAVGVLTLLGRRVPAALRVLLLALAVIDDLGAIVVIALFYSAGISLSGLLVVALGLGLLFVMRALGAPEALYVIPGVVVWAGVYAAGIHPTIAGVLIGLLTPVRAWLGPTGFARTVRAELDLLSEVPSGALTTHGLAETLSHVDAARREAISPASSLIETLHPWVAFVIMPLFALANAGVSLRGLSLDHGNARVALGAAVGLVVGKPVGVLIACAIALRLRVATLPRGLGARHLVTLGVVAGVGFTMALFIAQLAFRDAAMLSAAKLGVLLASAFAGVLGLALGRGLLRETEHPGAAESADEAERSTEL